MNNKETLIRQLLGNIESLKDTAKLFDDETLSIYTETGHVDCDFLTRFLETLSMLADVQVYFQKRLNKFLGITDEPVNRKALKKTSGIKMTPEEVFRACRFEDNIVHLPDIQLEKKTYEEVKNRIEQAGGSWTGGKVQGFTFPFNAERVWSILKTGGKCNLQQEFQFFETPDEIADWLVSLAGEIMETDRVLEPSAGRGSLIRAIGRQCPGKSVDCYELMPENQELLAQINTANIIGNDFMLECQGEYDKIIANPPFSGNQDIKHVRRMYELLADGGTLAAITSRHWIFGEESVCSEFRTWLDSVNGNRYDIEQGAFKNSGTQIGTAAVVVTKKKKQP
ncbi:MAG: SAM-dependent DNA methyltransferase [Bacteroidales bacterium]|nr:SAM-dependent DNA methyltransferase [Candidatus Cryptobacteroides equifaecalis]